MEILKTVARQRMHANQDALDFDDGQPGGEEAPIVSSRAKHLWEVLCTAYGVLGLGRACGEDEVFKLLALAQVIEPVSKLDSIRVLEEIGIAAVISDNQAPAAGLCNRPVAAAAGGGLRSPCRFGSGDPGDLRRAPRCTSRPIRATGSASPGSPRSAGWNRRSPSGC